MKIAITAQGRTLDALVDPRFGRAACFVVVDTQGEFFQVVDNQQNLAAAQGAGIQAAQAVADCGVAAVVTGHVGPKAFAALRAANIAIYTGASGQVADAVAQYQAGELQLAVGADVQGHWG